MSLRRASNGGCVLPSKQPPHSQVDCLPYAHDVATCARNDMQTVSLPVPYSSGRLQSQTGEELRPLFRSPSGATLLDGILLHTLPTRTIRNLSVVNL